MSVSELFALCRNVLNYLSGLGAKSINGNRSGLGIDFGLEALNESAQHPFHLGMQGEYSCAQKKNPRVKRPLLHPNGSFGREILGARPRIRRGRAHGACGASSTREEEAMSVHIVDDE